MKIRVQPLSDALLRGLQTSPVTALKGIGTVDQENVHHLKKVARMALEFYHRVGAGSPWTGYLVIADATGEVVGTCGFKGNPDPAGTVEISYGTFVNFQGRGVATAMARQLTAIALKEPAVTRVLAHTLPERNASCRVLEKAGFQRVGEVMDPEDGRVWRWEIRPPA